MKLKSDADRLEWADVAKGVAIVLVVFGHALRGLETAGLINFKGIWGHVDQVIYSFHMPLFFLLSGYFFFSAMSRPLLSFLRSRMTRLIWPLFLWTWIFFGAKLFAGDSVNSPIGSLEGFPFLPLPPRLHFWFLWGLFLVSVTAYGIGRFIPPQRAWELWVIVLTADIVWFSCFGAFGGTYVWFPMFSYFFGFFVLGLVLRQMPLPPISLGRMILSCLLFSVGCCVAYFVTPGIFLSFALAAFMCLSLCYLIRCLPSYGLHGKVFQSLGNASMAIYLTHTIFGAAIRIVMTKSGVDDVGSLLLAITLVGVFFPLVLDRLSRRFGFSPYLGW